MYVYIGGSSGQAPWMMDNGGNGPRGRYSIRLPVGMKSHGGL